MRIVVLRNLRTGLDQIECNVILRLRHGFYEGDIIEAKHNGGTIRGIIVWSGIRFELAWLKQDGTLNNMDANCGFPEDAIIVGSVFRDSSTIDTALLKQLGYYGYGGLETEEKGSSSSETTGATINQDPIEEKRDISDHGDGKDNIDSHPE